MSAVVNKGPIADFPDYYAVIVENEYQCLNNDSHKIRPTRNRKEKILRSIVRQSNNRSTDDRVLVENYFGLETALPNVMIHKYSWNDER